jgi:hypothetical protein
MAFSYREFEELVKNKKIFIEPKQNFIMPKEKQINPDWIDYPYDMTQLETRQTRLVTKEVSMTSSDYYYLKEKGILEKHLVANGIDLRLRYETREDINRIRIRQQREEIIRPNEGQPYLPDFPPNLFPREYIGWFHQFFTDKNKGPLNAIIWLIAKTDHQRTEGQIQFLLALLQRFQHEFPHQTWHELYENLKMELLRYYSKNYQTPLPPKQLPAPTPLLLFTDEALNS